MHELTAVWNFSKNSSVLEVRGFPKGGCKKNGLFTALLGKIQKKDLPLKLFAKANFQF